MLLRRKLCSCVLLPGLLMPVAGCHRTGRRIVATPGEDQTCVFLLRGFGNRKWSGGLDQLATQLGDNGCYASAESYRAWKEVVEDILRERPKKLVLIGHSHGGVVAIKAARILQHHGVAVRLLVLLDSGRPDPIPSNVDFAVHYYVVPTTMTFRHGPRDKLEPGNTHTRLTNVAVGRDGDVPEARDVDHLTITDSAAIHRMIVGQMAAAGMS